MQRRDGGGDNVGRDIGALEVMDVVEVEGSGGMEGAIGVERLRDFPLNENRVI